MIRLNFALAVLFLFARTAFCVPEDPRILHSSIMSAFDEKRYQEAAALLEHMNRQYPERYVALAYNLLHARSLELAGNTREAYPQYESVVAQQQLAPFALLPLARISAREGIVNSAIRHYKEYLRHSEYPEYTSVSREALEYCLSKGKAGDLIETAQIVQKNSSLRRLAQYHIAKAYLIRKENALARNLLLNLIVGSQKDDVTNLALTELDILEIGGLSYEEQKRRGRLAYDVWNFQLSRKYLEPLATKSMEAGFFYARTLFFLGDYDSAKRAFQVSLGLWPDDEMYRLCLYQYASVHLRDGSYAKAAELYSQLKDTTTGDMQDGVIHKLVYALRAQSKFEEALDVLGPYCSSRSVSRKGHALFLRGRVYFQMARYQDSVADFQQALNLTAFRNHKELMLWKGLALERLKKTKEAIALFSTLASGFDFYAHKARERVPGLKAPASGTAPKVVLPRLPDANKEDAILVRKTAGDYLPLLLYLHLYEEAAQLLPKVNQESWKILGINPAGKLERYLGITYLASLGGNYATATYYSEMFVKNLPRETYLFALSEDVLRTLFPLPYMDEIERFSKERDLDPLLIVSIMKQESKFKRYARSQTFARGLMQLIPSTAMRLATSVGMNDFHVEKLYQPEININLGTRYVRDIIQEFGDDIELVAAGYNGGEPNVRRWRACSTKNEILDFISSIDFTETKNYVMIVRTNYELYKKIYGDSVSTVLTGSSSKQ